MKVRSGDPRKRQSLKTSEQIVKSEKARRMALILSSENELKAEALRLLELFEEQYPDSPGFCYDELPYILIINAIVLHRADCELKGKPEKYDPLAQLDTLDLLPEMRGEMDTFLLRNKLDKAETWSVFG